MKLESNSPATSTMSASAWATFRHTLPLPVSKPEPSIWVRLVNPPTAFSFDEAWLLCETSENHWLAWIPDYGEILLHRDEFVIDM
jgi:hypothetical protein